MVNMISKDFDGFSLRIKRSNYDEWQAYFAECPQVCSKEKTVVIAIVKLIELWEQHKSECKINNKPIPIPLSEKNYSGQLNLRLDKQLHKALSYEAVQKKISLNALITKKLIQTTAIELPISQLKLSKVNVFPNFALLSFSSEVNQGITLKFGKINLEDIFEVSTFSENELSNRINSNSSLLSSLYDFISEQYLNGSIEQNDIIECILVTQLELRQATHFAVKEELKGKIRDKISKDNGFLVIKAENS